MKFALAISILIIIIAVILLLCISYYITIFGGGPFVPTKMKAVHKVLKAAKIKKGDKVYDIGAGDGRFIHFAAKDYGANSVGIELDPFVYFIAKIRQYFSKWKGQMILGSSFNHDLSDANVVICYMLPKPLKKFKKNSIKT